MTDTIKQVYDIFHYHLSEDTPRGKKINPKWDEFKNEISDLVSYAFVTGRHRGSEDMLKNMQADINLSLENAKEEQSDLTVKLTSRGRRLKLHKELNRARIFAADAHGSQKYGNHPYTQHLSDVAKVVERFNLFRYSPEYFVLCVAAWLHDVVEDTDVTFDDLAENFDSQVVSLVQAVTDEPGKNREERHAKTYLKIRKAGMFAVFLKLADRIANVENCIATGNEGLLGMYQKEHNGFVKVLRRDAELFNMWEHLDGLVQQSLSTHEA